MGIQKRGLGVTPGTYGSCIGATKEIWKDDEIKDHLLFVF